MQTYSKYIIKNIIPLFLMLSLVLTGLVWIIQVLNLINLFEKGISFKNFFKLSILLLPYLLFVIMPVVSLISMVYVYSRLQEERQLLVLRSAGLNNFKLLKPALLVASSITIIVYFISAYLMPISYNSLKLNLSNFKEGYISNIIDVKTFNQISKYITIYVDKKISNKSFEGVVLFDNKAAENRIIFFAQKGEIINFNQQKTEFELIKGVRHSYDKAGKLVKLYFDNMIVEVVNNNIPNTSPRNRTNLELFIHEMIYPDSTLTIEKQKILITEGHLRLIWPLYNFTFVFLALSIFLNFSYNRRNYLKQYIYSILPIMIVAYFHFSLQKIAYKDLNYIFLCYGNVFACIIFSIWQSTKNKL